MWRSETFENTHLTFLRVHVELFRAETVDLHKVHLIDAADLLHMSLTICEHPPDKVRPFQQECTLWWLDIILNPFSPSVPSSLHFHDFHHRPFGGSF